jgi:hypothetical protein
MPPNLWATIMPFGPVTNILLAQKTFFGPAKAGPHFRRCAPFDRGFEPQFGQTIKLVFVASLLSMQH